MSLALLGWWFAAGVVVHNLEEAWRLPAWSAHTGRWHARIGAGPFRFAVTVLSIAVLAAAWLSAAGGPLSPGAYFLNGYALAMVLNVLFPHVAASIALRRYAPGTVTAILLNLPLGGWLIYRSLDEGYIERSTFLVSGPLIVVAILASIPLLFALGKRLLGGSMR